MPQPTARRGPSRLVRRLIAAAALVVLVIAMVANTKFLTPDEVAAIAPKKFDPAAEAKTLWAQAQQELPGKAADLATALPKIQADPKAAADELGAVSPNENVYVYPIKVTGTVSSATDASLQLKVDGAPSQTPILVPLTVAVNGTVIRDVMGFTFGNAPGQTQYQYVGDELKKLMQAELEQKVGDPAKLEGKQVTVVGAVNITATGATVPRAKPISVQAVSVEVGS